MKKLYKAFLCGSVFMLHCGTAVIACDISVNRMTTIETNPATGIPTETMLSCAKKRDNSNFRAKLQKEFCAPDKINALKIDDLLKEIALKGVVATSGKILEAIEESGHFDKFYAAIDPKNQKKYGVEPSINDILKEIRKLAGGSGDPEEKINQIIQLIQKRKEILGRMTIFLIDDYSRSLSMLKDSEQELKNAPPKSWEKEKWEKQLSSLQTKMDSLFARTLREVQKKVDELSASESEEIRRAFVKKSIESDPDIYNLFSWINAKGIKLFKGDTNLMEFARLIDVCGR